MGYSTVAYAVDIDRLRSVFGSEDAQLLQKIEAKHAKDLRRGDKTFADQIRDGAPTQGEALRQIIAGKIEGPDWAGFQYGYVLEILCKHLGTLLDNDDLIAFISDLEIPTALIESGPPLPIPRPRDFPDIGYLTADQVREEYAHLKDQDLSHEDEDIEEARNEFL
ncbi:MAG TPA: hypothetical protein VFT74_16810, partial [Isosphaeraceae bacterium]|nr:hypothetical protein [Isosphaeraceae bacterium]